MDELVATLEGISGDPSQYFTVARQQRRALVEVDASGLPPQQERRPLQRQRQDSFSNMAGFAEVDYAPSSELGSLGRVRKGGRPLRRQRQDSFSNMAGLNDIEFAVARKKRPLRRQNQDSFSNQAMGVIQSLDFKGLGTDAGQQFVPVDMDFNRELVQINADELQTNPEGRRPLRRQNQDSFSNQVRGLNDWGSGQFWTRGYKAPGPLVIPSANTAFNNDVARVNRSEAVKKLHALTEAAVAVNTGKQIMTVMKPRSFGIIGLLALAALAL